MTELHLVPAYGKDYKSRTEATEAWNSDKDFQITNPGYPSYINRRDWLRYKDDFRNTGIWIRYNQRKHIVRVEGGTND